MNCLTAFLFAATICLVSCENCTFNGQCTSTTCLNNNNIICQHPDGDGIIEGNGLCTCAANEVECTMREDCYTVDTLNCQATQRHCYDNSCICDRFPIG